MYICFIHLHLRCSSKNPALLFKYRRPTGIFGGESSKTVPAHSQDYYWKTGKAPTVIEPATRIGIYLNPSVGLRDYCVVSWKGSILSVSRRDRSGPLKSEFLDSVGRPTSISVSAL